MGPDRRYNPGNDILMPPYLGPKTDKFLWRKHVQRWATTVKRFASGGDNKAQGIDNALGLTLFNALDNVFASKVERTVRAGLVSLDFEYEGESNASAQQQVVKDIISIVAKETPTDGTRRLVQMMRKCIQLFKETWRVDRDLCKEIPKSRPGTSKPLRLHGS